MKHTDIADVIGSQDLFNMEITVCGWVRTSRNSKSVAFIELNDGTSLKNIQIVVEKGDGDYKEPRVGMSLKVCGKVAAGRNNTVEINTLPEGITVLGDAPTDYPLQKKGHSLEFLRTISEAERTPSMLYGACARCWLPLSMNTSRATTSFM